MVIGDLNDFMKEAAVFKIKLTAAHCELLCFNYFLDRATDTRFSISGYRYPLYQNDVIFKTLNYAFESRIMNSLLTFRPCGLNGRLRLCMEKQKNLVKSNNF